MTKHKIIIVWACLFLTVLVLNIFFSVLIGGIWVMALSIPIILFLFCPIFIIDLLVSSKPSKLEPRKEKMETQQD